MTELLTQPALLQEQPAYPHQTDQDVSVDALRAHFSDSPDLYPDIFKPVAEEFLSRKEQEQLTSEQVREDSLNHLMTPEAGRKASEVHDPFTGEVRKPCFELEIDSEAKAEVADVLGKRSEGLAVVHSLLDKLPPIKHGRLEAGTLPLIDSLQPYLDKAEAVYNQRHIEKQDHASKVAEMRKTNDYANDPFGGPAIPQRPLRPDIELNEVQYMWRLPKNENADYSAQPVGELVGGIVKEYEDFGRWRSKMAESLEANRALVAEGSWPGEKILAEIEDEANRRDPHTQGSKEELVRSLLAGQMVADLGFHSEHNERHVLDSQNEWAKTLSIKVKSGLLSSL